MAWRGSCVRTLLQQCTKSSSACTSQPLQRAWLAEALPPDASTSCMGQPSCSGDASTSFTPLGFGRSPSLHRHYSSDSSSAATPSIGNEKLQKLANEILGLTVLESSHLTEILRKKLGLQKPAYGAMPAFAMAGAPPAATTATPAAAAPAAAKEEKPAEKTDFEVKLDSFSADGKIKVIKEIRAITSLGLKEAKELVEKAPVVIKANVPKADAEAMKKQIEAAGGKITLA